MTWGVVYGILSTALLKMFLKGWHPLMVLARILKMEDRRDIISDVRWELTNIGVLVLNNWIVMQNLCHLVQLLAFRPPAGNLHLCVTLIVSYFSLLKYFFFNECYYLHFREGLIIPNLTCVRDRNWFFKNDTYRGKKSYVHGNVSLKKRQFCSFMAKSQLIN